MFRNAQISGNKKGVMVDKTFDECIYGGLFFIEIWMCVIEKH